MAEPRRPPDRAALLVGALELVGPNEKDGWRLAGTLVPITYVAWSAWLIALGVALWLSRGPGCPSSPGGGPP